MNVALSLQFFTAVLSLTMSSLFAAPIANSQTTQNEPIGSTVYGRVVYDNTDRLVFILPPGVQSSTLDQLAEPLCFLWTKNPGDKH